MGNPMDPIYALARLLASCNEGEPMSVTIRTGGRTISFIKDAAMRDADLLSRGNFGSARRPQNTMTINGVQFDLVETVRS